MLDDQGSRVELSSGAPRAYFVQLRLELPFGKLLTRGLACSDRVVTIDLGWRVGLVVVKRRLG